MTLGMVLLAVTLGLDVFAGGLSLGVKGLERAQWAKAALIFSFFAFAMTTLGVLFGRLLGDSLGSRASYIAGAALLVVGLRAVTDVFLGGEKNHAGVAKRLSLATIALTGLMVCLDKLAVGVSLAFVDVRVTPLIAFLVVQSFLATLLGLALGQRLGAKIEEIAEVVAGSVFVILGLLIIYQTWASRSLI